MAEEKFMCDVIIQQMVSFSTSFHSPSLDIL